MRKRLPIVLSATALAVALLGFTSLGEAAKRLVLPRNSVGTQQIKPGAVKRSDLGANAVNSTKVGDGTLLALDFKAGELPQFTGVAAGGDLAGTYPNPTIKDGAVTTARLADGVVTPAKVGTIPAVRAFHSANQAVPGDASFTAVALNSERFDTTGLHRTDLDTSRITIATTGVYVISTSLSWEGNDAGAREVAIRRNGTTSIARDVVDPSLAPNTTEQVVTTVARLAAGDFVEVVVRQNSAAILNIFASAEFSPEFSAVWVAPA